MEKRTGIVLTLVAAALLCAFGVVHAQENVVTNATQLAAIFDQPSLVFPLVNVAEPAMFIPALDIFWADFDQLTNAISDVRNNRGQTVDGGITAFPLRLTRTVSGVSIAYPWDGTELWQASAPPGDDFATRYSEALAEWCDMIGVADASCSNSPEAQSYGLDPARLVLDIWMADVNDYSAYTNNLAAEADCTDGGDASGMPAFGSSFMSMDDEDDASDPCSITNLTQPFFVTSVVQTTNGLSITWQSCQIFRYLVWEANSLSTNTQWIPTAYVWGSNNVGVTSWTDSATTNDDGNTVSQRFYRVQRLLGLPIAAGGESSVALRPDGTLWAWGTSEGELGDGLDFTIERDNSSFVETYLPYPSDVANAASCGVQTITNAAMVAAGGDDYTVVVDATGTVWTFGENTQGQLGNGLGNGSIDTPAPVTNATGFTNAVNVAAGFQHVLALCADGSVWAWGNDSFGAAREGPANGALGAGTLLQSQGLTATNSPVQTLIPTGTLIVAIAAGDGFSLAVGTNGQVWGWGDNEYGEIGTGTSSGIGTDAGTNLPILVQGISNVIAVAAGANTSSIDLDITGGGHSIALTADKRVWTWGDNEFGELGRNTGTFDPSPGLVTGLTNQYVVAIAGGLGFTLAVTSNGQVYAWGDNTYGELGTNANAIASTNRPILVGGITNAVWVSAPRSDDGICNVSGPQVQICTNYPSGAEYVGGVHAMAMTLNPVDGTGQTTNRFWGWGDNTYGQVGTGLNGGATNQVSQYSSAGPLQFCTRCQREVQLGSNGTFQAQCSGTLYLYFNSDHFVYVQGSYSATVNGSNVAVMATNYVGVAVGTVTNGGVYTFSSSGSCSTGSGVYATPDGTDSMTGTQVDCSVSSVNYVNMTNSICPALKCYSLVGKIQ